MKKKNWPLIIGGLIILFIILVMIFPQLFTKINPYGTQYFKNATVDIHGRYSVDGAPFSPSKEYRWGSDDLGRDIFSLIIYGTRLTIALGALIAIGRFIIAIPVGIGSGFGNKICKTLVNQFIIAFSAIPALIVCIIVLKIKYFSGLFKTQSVISFVTILTIVGWAKPAKIISERVENLLASPFIKGETAIGKSRYKIALENIIPHLSAELVVLFFMEIASALSMVMQLGIFNVFVGNVRMIDDSGPLNVSFEPEWASILGTTSTRLISAPWTVIYPALAFFVSILGFNLFGEGIRSLLQSKTSMFIPGVRHALSFDKSDLKLSNFNPVKGKFKVLTAFVLIAAIIFSSNYVRDKKYNFNSENVMAESNFNIPDNAVSGTQNSGILAQKISDEFSKLGFKPLDKKGFITEYNFGKKYYLYSSSVKINSNGKEYELSAGKDFAPSGFGDYETSGTLIDTTDIDLFSFKNYNEFKDKIVMINGDIYSKDTMNYFAGKIMKEVKAKAILFILKDGDELPDLVGDKKLSYPELYVTHNSINNINKAGISSISISLKCMETNSAGKNIIGIIKGTDSKMKDKAIMIGLSYNYLPGNKQLGFQKLKFAIELMKKIASEKRDRAVIIAFFDGTLTDSTNGARYYSKNSIYQPDDTSIFIDLTSLNSYKFDSLSYNSSQAPSTRYFAYCFGHQLETNLKNINIGINNFNKVRPSSAVLESTPNAFESMYYTGSIASIVISVDNTSGIFGKFSLDDLGRVLVKTIQTNKY